MKVVTVQAVKKRFFFVANLNQPSLIYKVKLSFLRAFLTNKIDVSTVSKSSSKCSYCLVFYEILCVLILSPINSILSNQ